MINRSLKRILITGVSGFLGRALARYFSGQGASVFGTDRLAAENAPLADLQAYAALTLPEARFEKLLDDWRPQVVIHCAGHASVPKSMEDPVTDYQGGPALTFYVLDAIRRMAPRCGFVFLSSAAVYGNPGKLPVSEDHPLQPISVYGYHKWQGELICKEFASVYGLRTVSARIFSAYGPGLRRQVMWDIVRKALTCSTVQLEGTGQESRDFIHTEDIVQGLEIIINNAVMQGEAYNLASGQETKIADLAALLLDSLDIKSNIVFSGQSPSGVPRNWKADIGLMGTFGFAPQMSLGNGVRNFAQWARSQLQGG